MVVTFTPSGRYNVFRTGLRLESFVGLSQAIFLDET
jgi:hypothetical protein